MTTPDPSRRSPWRRRTALLAVSTLVTLVAAEVAARVRAQLANRETLEAAFRAPQGLSAGQGQAALVDIIQPSTDDRIAYELRPGLSSVPFKARPVSTNALGFRSPEVAPAGPDTVTILGIGDSIMFGHGVGDGETYLDRLGEILAAEHPHVDWRVINTAVPGYNAVMEVETLERKGLALEPDLVVLGVCGNDYAPPVYVRVADDVLDLSRSFFLDFLAEKLGGARPAHRDQALTHRETWGRESGLGSEAAPGRYADLHGEGPFLGALDRLRELSGSHGFEVLAFATYDASAVPEMMAACAERGFPTVHLQPELEAYLQQATGQPFSWDLLLHSDLAVNPDNGHPSVKQHWMAARRLYLAMDELGLIEKLTSGR